MYEGILKCYKNGIWKFFEKMGESGEGGVLSHCSAVKDRTGVMAAMILAFFGASWIG